ncbi:MAG: hypothetical protein K6G60_07515 [Lachnospiraceae bacterium]|nr:hypothetical protein [Lachnospiraceae bacterium]
MLKTLEYKELTELWKEVHKDGNNNAFLQGLYLALCGVMLLLATPVGGVLGDRFNKGAIMFICDYIKGGLIILGTTIMLFFNMNPVHHPAVIRISSKYRNKT